MKQSTICIQFCFTKTLLFYNIEIGCVANYFFLKTSFLPKQSFSMKLDNE